MRFSLYVTERSIFTFDDYGALISECRRIGARSAIEFGPGVSTTAFVEAGCERILTCEHDEAFIEKARAAAAEHLAIEVARYRNEPDVSVDGLGDETFDIAFVDSPVGGESRRRVIQPDAPDCSRLNTVMFALRVAPVVLLHDAKRPAELETIYHVMDLGHRAEMIDTRKGIARITRAS